MRFATPISIPGRWMRGDIDHHAEIVHFLDHSLSVIVDTPQVYTSLQASMNALVMLCAVSCIERRPSRWRVRPARRR